MTTTRFPADHERTDVSAQAEHGRQPRTFTRPAKRRFIRRRLAVLAAAIAVPAMAAPNIDRRAEPQVIRFVLPETIPYEAPAAGAEFTPSDEAAGDELAQQALSFTDEQHFFSGPAAPTFAMSGGITTRLRAEKCLTQAIYYEAASEPTSGQRAVAQVVMNRVQHPQYPNSVCGVVFQGSQRQTGCQFSFTCDGSMARQPQDAAWQRAGRVARAALGGFVYDVVGMATHYHTLQVNPYWASSLDPVGVVGAHRFYRWKGSAGGRAAFTASYDGYEMSPAMLQANARLAANSDHVSYTAAVPALPALPALPASSAAADHAPARTAPADNLPASGSVLDIHSQSGQWLKQP